MRYFIQELTDDCHGGQYLGYEFEHGIWIQACRDRDMNGKMRGWRPTDVATLYTNNTKKWEVSQEEAAMILFEARP